MINGPGLSGKDTFSEMMKKLIEKTQINGKVINYSTIDIYKKISLALGWDGVSKTAADREFWKGLKKVSIQYNNFPTELAEREVKGFRRKAETEKKDFLYVFIHCREAEEIEKLVDRLSDLKNTTVHTIFMENPTLNCPLVDSNVFDYEDYDFKFEVKTLQDIEDRVEHFLIKTL